MSLLPVFLTLETRLGRKCGREIVCVYLRVCTGARVGCVCEKTSVAVCVAPPHPPWIAKIPAGYRMPYEMYPLTPKIRALDFRA